MSEFDRFAILWTDYLEGELDDAGLIELRELFEAKPDLVQLAADLFQTHRLLGLIPAEQPVLKDQFIKETLELLPETPETFIKNIMSQVQRGSNQTNSESVAHSTISAAQSTNSATKTKSSQFWQIAAALLVVASIAMLSWSNRSNLITTTSENSSKKVVAQNSLTNPNPNTVETGGTLVSPGKVHLKSLAHAKFFGELPPPAGSILAPRREYVLMNGLVEIGFPQGATAILEGPAVFRVISDESLALDVGTCSVHAPDGAEGFHIETPVTRVVDRGTRFTVSVGETTETEVHVIEGIADVYERKDPSNREPLNVGETRLNIGEAKKFVVAGNFAKSKVPFNSSAYRSQLPDRVISYTATKGVDGHAENLTSVTIQRGGKVLEIPVEEMILSRVISFKSTTPRAFLCGSSTLPETRTDTTADHSLVTGVINPDGSKEPLVSDPIVTGEKTTPGLAVRFDRPVTNGPGADVVFFDLQTFGNPSEGDAFHVSPMTFHEGLHSHTIRKYDLTMESSEALELTNFFVHSFKETADSIDKLESLPCASQKQAIRFRGLAVGIDLSDLGYQPGETVEGLFFQDALDDKHTVDPVFIGGLPEMK